jgi:hypothetical protein
MKYSAIFPNKKQGVLVYGIANTLFGSVQKRSFPHTGCQKKNHWLL